MGNILNSCGRSETIKIENIRKGDKFRLNKEVMALETIIGNEVYYFKDTIFWVVENQSRQYGNHILRLHPQRGLDIIIRDKAQIQEFLEHSTQLINQKISNDDQKIISSEEIKQLIKNAGENIAQTRARQKIQEMYKIEEKYINMINENHNTKKVKAMKLKKIKSNKMVEKKKLTEQRRLLINKLSKAESSLSNIELLAHTIIHNKQERKTNLNSKEMCPAGKTKASEKYSHKEKINQQKFNSYTHAKSLLQHVPLYHEREINSSTNDKKNQDDNFLTYNQNQKNGGMAPASETNTLYFIFTLLIFGVLIYRVHHKMTNVYSRWKDLRSFFFCCMNYIEKNNFPASMYFMFMLLIFGTMVYQIYQKLARAYSKYKCLRSFFSE